MTTNREKVEALIRYNSNVKLDSLTTEARKYIEGYVQALNDVLDVIE